MNGDAAEPAPVWERPWSLDEIRKGSQSWSLASDAGLLHFLQEFSQQTISRTHEIKKQVDGLINETKATDCRLHNVFNDFLMLSNTQFIENLVLQKSAKRAGCERCCEPSLEYMMKKWKSLFPKLMLETKQSR
uniref:Uncharacterized protein n=1 Tax=Corvus moneduloides TaxID=1196302 RepID=A0A8U7MCA0_CORMO